MTWPMQGFLTSEQVRRLGRMVLGLRCSLNRSTPVLAVLILFSLTLTANAQSLGAPIDDPKSRIEQLEREIADLKSNLQQPDSRAIGKIVEQKLNELKAEEAAKKKAEEERKKYDWMTIGLDRKLNVTWDAGGFRFRSADEAFNI